MPGIPRPAPHLVRLADAKLRGAILFPQWYDRSRRAASRSRPMHLGDGATPLPDCERVQKAAPASAGRRGSRRGRLLLSRAAAPSLPQTRRSATPALPHRARSRHDVRPVRADHLRSRSAAARLWKD